MARSILLDLLRTAAIGGMIAYHAAYDLAEFGGWAMNVHIGGWWLLSRATLTLFLFVVCMSFAVSWERGKGTVWHRRIQRYVHRSAVLMFCAILVSVGTFAFEPTTFVFFGVLHMIAVSMILLPLLAPCGIWNSILGVIVIVMGTVITGMNAPSMWLLPLGALPVGWTTVDYVPLFPWFGVILLGFAAAKFVGIERILHPSYIPGKGVVSMMVAPGRRALVIYLLHQPILVMGTIVVTRG